MFVHSTESKLIASLIVRGAHVEKHMLGIGDCVVSERTAIERKGGNYNPKTRRYEHDFVASIFDGRLKKQAQDLRDNYNNPIMIIESYSKLYKDPRISKENILTNMAMLTTSFGIHIITTETTDQTAHVIIQLNIFDETEGYAPPINKHPKPRNINESQVYLLTGLTKVGFKKAIELLTILKTPMKVLEEVVASHYIKPPRGRKKKLISIYNALHGYGEKFVDNNKSLLTHEFDPSQVRVNKRRKR